MSSTSRPSVDEFYSNKSLFITGATGMLGKCLVRRLLDTTYPSMVYILMRGKPGVDIGHRFNKYLEDEAFETLDNKESQLAKLVPVEGDISLPRLGLSDSDYDQVTQNAQIVFHSAASVKWNEGLCTAININIRGTQEVLDICRAMKNHCLLMHISSYACWMERDVLEEKVLRSGLSPKNLIQDAKNKTGSEMELLGKNYIGKHMPKSCNSYVLTKTMAEVLIAENVGDLNIVIARLPLFTPAAKFPSQGWVASLQINNASLVAGIAGLIRGYYQDGTIPALVLPVDMACNALITSAWETATRLRDVSTKTVLSPIVYNIVPSASQSLSFYDISLIGHDLGTRYPSINQLLPTLDISGGVEGRLSFMLKQNLLLLFSYLVQILVLVVAQRSVPLVKVVKKLNTGMKIAIYEVHKWTFDVHNDNIEHLYAEDGPMTQDERDKFYYEPEKADYREIYKHMYLNFRRNVLGEPDSNFDAARQRMKRFKVLLGMVKYFAYAIVAACLFQSAINLIGN